MGRSGLSCSVAFNGSTCFANVLIAQPQKHFALSHLALEPKCGSPPYYNKIKRIVTNVTILFIWAAVDSNHRPHPYQGCALTT